MANSSAAYLLIRKRKAQKEVAAEVSGVAIETEEDGGVVIRNAEEGHWIATLEDCQPDDPCQEEDVRAKLEYLDVEGGSDERIVKRIRSVLSRYTAR